jgi:nucleoside-diphosphate-sugar epimerase
MRTLVTGATGVYGRSVVERLRRAGHDVTAMARSVPRTLPHGVRFAQGDVANADDVLRAMDGCEAVVHLAFVVSPLKDRELSRRISVGGAQNVVDAMQQTGARRLVFASSAMSYGSNPDNPPLFGEDDLQRPAPDYVYGSDKVAAERVILDSGVDAVLARTAITVGRNIDNLLLDIFAGPAIVGIKGVDIRYQLIHQEDVGRFLAYAVEHGPGGPVNVAPSDFIELRRLAELLGKRYVEVTEAQAVKGVTFAWEHDLVDITPGEAAGISYMPRLATDRLRDAWEFECAWTTAEAALDLRRAVTGRAAVGKRRFELPWRLRFPAQRPGEAVNGGPTEPYGGLSSVGELDTFGGLEHPTYTAATAANVPLPALTLSTTAYLLRAAANGVLDSLGVDPDTRQRLGAVSVGVFGHRLYVNDDVAAAAAGAPRARRRLVAARYDDEVTRLSGWADDTLAAATDLSGRSDGKLDAILSALRDDLAWFWAIASTGAALDGRPLGGLDPLITLLPTGASLAAINGPVEPLPAGRHDGPRARAERTALALAQALAAAVRERSTRLVAGGVLTAIDDAAHLTWDELAAPPGDAAAIVMRRRAEHEQLAASSVPRTVSIVTAAAALQTETPMAMAAGVPA